MTMDEEQWREPPLGSDQTEKFAATKHSPASSPPSEGWIGGYHLLRRIGSGGSGTVWEASDEGGNRVALKTLHPSVAETHLGRERLLREARLVNQIKSDYVSRVLDVEADAITPFVVTEFVEGPTLERAFAGRGLSAHETLDLGRQLAQLLEDVHDAGVAHRDLKPSNIILSQSGPVLIDFGIAQSAEDGRLTQSGSVTGTPGYVAPEILRNQDDPSIGQWQKSDWFAWAALLLSASTGRPPFGRGAIDAILHRLFSGEPDVEGLPDTLAHAFRGALSPEPSLRTSPSGLLLTLSRESGLFDDFSETSIVNYFGSEGGFKEATEFNLTPHPPTTTQQLPPDYQTPYAFGLKGENGPTYEDSGVGQTSYFAPYQGLEDQQRHYFPALPHQLPKSSPLLAAVLLAIVAWLPGNFGFWWIFLGFGLLLVAQVAGRIETQMAARRNTFGAKRRSDWPVALLSSPWTLISGAGALIPGLFAGALVFVALIGAASLIQYAIAMTPLEARAILGWLQGRQSSPLPSWQTAVATWACFLAVWAFPTSSWARIGLSRFFNTVAPSTTTRWIWGIVMVAFCTILALP